MNEPADPTAAVPAEPTVQAAPTVPAEPGLPVEPTVLADPTVPVRRRRSTKAGASQIEITASLSPFERVVPTWTDPTVRRASQLIGGPLGRHAQVGRLPILTPLRLCLLMALVFLIFGWLAKSPCIQQTPGANGLFVLDSSANRQWISGCYNDVVPAYQIHGLDQSIAPYAVHLGTDGATLPALPYPVLIGAFMWLAARLTGGYLSFVISTGVLPKPLDVAAYFSIGAILLGLLYLWAVASTVKMSRRRPWDTAIMCLSPLLVVHAFTNWDILPIALLAAGMLAWSRNRLVWAGLLLGLAVAAKLYPVLLLVPLAILCLRAGKLRQFTITAVVTVLTWGVVNLPWALAYPDAWREFYAVNTDRKPEFTTVWSIFSDWSGSTLFNPELPAGSAPRLLNAVTVLLVIAAFIGIAWLGLSAARRPRVAQLMFLTLASFLLISKTWNPQFSLWLLPLAVLALPRWRQLLIWQLAECMLWFLLMLTFASKADNPAHYALLSAYPFQVTALIRDALLVYLMVLIIRDILRPATDPVRMAGDDDPTGGVLADAPDRLTVVSLPALLGFAKPPAPPGPELGEIFAVDAVELR